MIKKIIEIKNRFLWKKQVAKIYDTKDINMNQLNLNGLKTIILVPHADDELIGCYHFLKKNKKNSLLVFFNFTGSNNNDSNIRTRNNEFTNFCKKEGFEFTILKNYERDLIEILEQYKPELILMPTFIDWHSEHRAINIILKQIISKITFNLYIGWYQISVALPIKYINFLINIDKRELKTKKKLFSKYYSSQKNLPIDRFLIRSIYYGNKLDLYGFEGFFILDLSIWKEFIDINIENLVDLKKHINNLFATEKLAEDIFENILENFSRR